MNAERLVVAIASATLLLACGTETPPKQPAVSRQARAATPPSAAISPVASAHCEGAQIEDHAPGHHDRYVFESKAGVGFRNAAGAEVIAPRFRFAYPFSPDGVAAVADAHGFAFINTGGAVIARAYMADNGPDYFSEGLARITDDGKIGFMDRRGQIVLSPRFDHATAFHCGRSKVCVGCKVIREPEDVRLEGGRRFVIDPKGRELPPGARGVE